MASLGDDQCNKQSRRPHILMVPLMGFGHYYQFEQLLRLCAEYDDGVTVTFACHPGRCAQVADLHAKGELKGIDLKFEHVFGPPALYPQDEKFPYRAAVIAENCRKEFEPFAKKLIGLKEKGLPGVPTCIMSDMFLCFTKELASQLDIPWYSVYVASPPYSAVCCLDVPKLYKEKLHPLESPRRNEQVQIPGGNFCRIRDIPHENLEFPEYWHYHSEKMSKAAGLVYNSAEALDSPAGALDAIRAGTQLRARAANRKAPKVFAIGPVLNFPGFTGTSTDTATVIPGTSMASLDFLSTHLASSAIYISFGSAGNISPESMTELAHGIEASGVPFVWALKLSGSLAGVTLPPGFEERTKGRGFIEQGWAPQAQILSHPSVGGFLSHCGWNSVLEGLCAGVPMVTWPVAAEQPLNARFAENAANSAISVKEYMPGDERIIEPSREDVKKSVRLLMVEEKGKELRKNAQEWKVVLKAAVAEGGSSYKALHELMDEVLLKSEDKGKK